MGKHLDACLTAECGDESLYAADQSMMGFEWKASGGRSDINKATVMVCNAFCQLATLQCSKLAKFRFWHKIKFCSTGGFLPLTR